MKLLHFIVLCSLLLLNGFSSQHGHLLDGFERLEGWVPITSEGARLNLSEGIGIQGRCLVMDFAFAGGAGYAIAQKTLPLVLPENYRFTFYLKGDAPVNNLEFKLLDSAGNVYWLKRLDVVFPKDWKREVIPKRRIAFAWGPAGGGEPRRIEKIEFVVSAGAGGGAGRVCIDEFYLEPIEDHLSTERMPTVRFSSGKGGSVSRPGPQGVSLAGWRTTARKNSQWLQLDLGAVRELGGLTIWWGRADYGVGYDVQLSEDSATWHTVSSVTRGNGGRDDIPIPDGEARCVRVLMRKSSRGKGYEIDSLCVRGAEFASTPNSLYVSIASSVPEGLFPKYLRGKQSYWTVVGVSGDTKEALVNQEGQVEVERAGFSLEPFIFTGGKLVSWAQVVPEQALEDGYLPMPSVTWTLPQLQLTIRPVATGRADSSFLLVAYTVHNTGTRSERGSLFIAVRPFQVLPPWQELNMTGGVSRIGRLSWDGACVDVNGGKRVVPLSRPDRFGAATFEQGDISEYLSRGAVPADTAAVDSMGYASGALEFDFSLQPGTEREVTLCVPFHDAVPSPLADCGWGPDGPPLRASISATVDTTRRDWQEQLNRVLIGLPPKYDGLFRTMRSNLAYILINRDGPAIQPGSRTYKRSWIRDGALTSVALLEMGIAREVREYIEWYARFIWPTGKVPCVVDARGADPVPEYDSNGEFIFAVMQYFRFTRDTTWLRTMWPTVRRVVGYVEELRNLRKTATFREGTAEERACYGLLPESISHEGYSDKPRHSYWDDFFALRGLKDAAAMASALGKGSDERVIASQRDDLRRCLEGSLGLVIRSKRIDYVPGCVELGDFDPTSTAIAVCPGGELEHLPEPELRHTYVRYAQFFADRRDGRIAWTNYTPYEVRIIGTYVLLGERQMADELLSYFMKDRRPPSWNQWAEVVWRDSTAPRMIGDMPHTWVGSDFIRAVRSMFVYEQEADESLVIGAGVPESWVSENPGVTVRNLPTYFGALSYVMNMQKGQVRVAIEKGVKPPPGGIIVCSPSERPLKSVRLNGRVVEALDRNRVRVPDVPAVVVFSY